MHELMFQAGVHVKGMSERSELIPCIYIYIQWSLRITDTLVHRPLSVIRGVSFIGVFCFSHITLHLNPCLIIILLSTMYYCES